MPKRNRTKTVYLNSIVTLISQIAQIVLGFLIRKIFINYLGIAYLGYNSVFVNILQMLNLADMGISVAITSFLYKPLAENDKKSINAIMAIYKKIYSILGIFVLVVGIFISFFLGSLIPDATCSLWYLRTLFYINLVGTVSTYFLAYKRTLLIADQKSYLTNIVDTIIFFIISGLQILTLMFTRNYIIYLILNILKNIISNIVISIGTNKKYKYINFKPDTDFVEKYKPQIAQYVKDVFVSKIGAVIYYSTDNIILSVIKGSLITGYLSNYTMITTQLNTIVAQVLGSVQATFGNFISTTKDENAKREMTDNYFCVNFFIGNFCMICFSLLAQPFVKLFFGENMLLCFSTAIWLGINLMLSFLIQLPSQVFVIYRLFRFDRPIIIVSAGLNIAISILGVNIVGLNGVLIGTFITSLVYLFSRLYIIAKHVYKIRYRYYLKKMLYYFSVSIISFLVTYFMTRKMQVVDIFSFGIRAIVVGCLASFSTALCLSASREFNFLVSRFLPSNLKKKIQKILILILCIIIIAAVLFMQGEKKEDFSTAGNKSYVRNDTYRVNEYSGNNIFHLSIDDTILIFKDLVENEYNSIFENPTLKWCKEIHDKYGVVMTFYVYFESNEFNLTAAPDKFKTEFETNSNWLRFGFHAINDNTEYSKGKIADDYVKTIDELIRIVGAKSIDNVIRLQMFQGSYEGIQELVALEKEPVIGLLTADDNRSNYYLSPNENTWIYCHDELVEKRLKIKLYSTDFRIEYVTNMDSKIKELRDVCWNNQLGDLVVFTHEWALSYENRIKIEKICVYAVENNYDFVFFEDINDKGE